MKKQSSLSYLRLHVTTLFSGQNGNASSNQNFHFHILVWSFYANIKMKMEKLFVI